MQNFRTYQLAKELFHDLKGLKVSGPMKDQLERASLSIVLNFQINQKPRAWAGHLRP